jgi:hypothetical protein
MVVPSKVAARRVHSFSGIAAGARQRQIACPDVLDLGYAVEHAEPPLPGGGGG